MGRPAPPRVVPGADLTPSSPRPPSCGPRPTLNTVRQETPLPASVPPAVFQAAELAGLMGERWAAAKASGVREHLAQGNGAGCPPVNAWGQSKLHFGGNFLRDLADKLNAQGR